MGQKCTINELPGHKGESAELNGWVAGRRSSGKLVFLQIRDGTGICQCVVEIACAAAFEVATRVGQESAVRVSGTVRGDDRAPGGVELAVEDLVILDDAVEYPITRKPHGIDFLMNHRHLWLRSRRPTAIMRVRHTAIRACRDFFDSRGFTLVDTPILQPGAGEDNQSLFTVQYFDSSAYLAQTGQLYLESACMALRKVYCFGPTFRAEKSKTRRHLTEFWMIEPEIAFAELGDVMELAEGLVCAIVARVLEENRSDLALLGRDLSCLERIRAPFPRLTYSAAAELLRSEKLRRKLEDEFGRDKAEFQARVNRLAELQEKLKQATKQTHRDKVEAELHELGESIHDMEQDLANRPEHMRLAAGFEWGKDLGGSDETILARQFDRPVFVTHYPRQAKAFYMKIDPADPRVVCNMDLLAPEGYGEIIGGSQREDDLGTLVGRMREMGLNEADFDWYLDLRRYGSVPHGGFGLGIERTVAWICGLQHVRETIPFPRTMGRMYP